MKYNPSLLMNTTAQLLEIVKPTVLCEETSFFPNQLDLGDKSLLKGFDEGGMLRDLWKGLA